MLNVRLTVIRQQYGNNIKAGWLIELVFSTQVVQGNPGQLGLFLSGHCLKRLTIEQTLSRFHLYKDQAVTITGYDINFSCFLPVISLKDRETQIFEKACSQVFTMFAEGYPCLRQTLSLL